MKNKDRYNLSELSVSKDKLFGVPILRVYEGRDLETRKEIAMIRRGEQNRTNYLLDWLEEEYSPLDDKEKEYLSAVIRPWRDRVKSIIKVQYSEEEEYIGFDIGSRHIGFPPFKADTMYKGMELNKEYTLEELKI